MWALKSSKAQGTKGGEKKHFLPILKKDPCFELYQGASHKRFWFFNFASHQAVSENCDNVIPVK